MLSPRAQRAFLSIMSLIMSIFLITIAALILRNEIPHFERVAAMLLVIYAMIAS